MSTQVSHIEFSSTHIPVVDIGKMLKLKQVRDLSQGMIEYGSDMLLFTPLASMARLNTFFKFAPAKIRRKMSGSAAIYMALKFSDRLQAIAAASYGGVLCEFTVVDDLPDLSIHGLATPKGALMMCYDLTQQPLLIWGYFEDVIALVPNALCFA